MRRAERLFQIIQILRRSRRPVTARALAEELETSLRTIYRDMAELLAQQVPIRGEAGVGYILEAGFDMPPLMLTPDEIEAAVLGAQWVASRGDAALARGARDLVAKIEAVVPEHLRPIILSGSLMAPGSPRLTADALDMEQVRTSIRKRRKLRIGYADESAKISERTIWPIGVAYFEAVRLIVSWCELRRDFRNFRTDRIQHAEFLSETFPERTEKLLADWWRQDRHNPDRDRRCDQ